jgi:hypothetical protein
MRHRTTLTVCIVAIMLQFVCSWSAPVQAAWLPNGVPISTRAQDENPTVIVSDGANGAIVFWHDIVGSFEETYGQRVNSDGVTQWGANGVSMCSGAWSQTRPSAVSGPDNGAIVFWEDNRTGISNRNIYAQRVNGQGIAQWANCGIPLSTASETEGQILAMSDRSNIIGGVAGWIALWVRSVSGTAEYRMQRVEDDGAGLWTPAANGGVALVTGITNVSVLNTKAMTNDGVGVFTVGPQGAVVAWAEKRSPGTNGYDIYARRINAGGTPQWTANGVLVAGLAGDQVDPAIVNVGGANTIVAWTDGDIFAQKLNSSGTAQWPANGLPICQAAGGQTRPLLTSDGAGGVIAVWQDSLPLKLYAQRLDGNGQRLWLPADGIPVGSASGLQSDHAVVSDGAGGVIVVWMDHFGFQSQRHIYGQRIDANGNLVWPSEGLPLTTATGFQEKPLLTSDGQSGAIAAWSHRFIGHVERDIYANRVFAGGLVDVPAVGPQKLRLSFVSSNPAKGEVRMKLDLPESAIVTADVLDASGRRVRSLCSSSGFGVGTHFLTWDGANGAGIPAAPGVYFVRVQAGASTLMTRVVELH